VLKKGEGQQLHSPEKRDLEGTSLSTHNSFAALSNKLIVDLAMDMGVDISSMNFENVELIKYREIRISTK
jgi:hypothetical protein